MKTLLDSFFDYVAVRERRERLMVRIGITGMAASAIFVAAVIAYVNLR